ncbi:hypothetical protein C8R45DRAFT_1159494 [Mycena sanguinolenta]|nr:hypothetical protein C8R45DRAFT_1159494 [Mycena sanguinolenta]
MLIPNTAGDAPHSFGVASGTSKGHTLLLVPFLTAVELVIPWSPGCWPPRPHKAQSTERAPPAPPHVPRPRIRTCILLSSPTNASLLPPPNDVTRAPRGTDPHSRPYSPASDPPSLCSSRLGSSSTPSTSTDPTPPQRSGVLVLIAHRCAAPGLLTTRHDGSSLLRTYLHQHDRHARYRRDSSRGSFSFSSAARASSGRVLCTPHASPPRTCHRLPQHPSPASPLLPSHARTTYTQASPFPSSYAAPRRLLPAESTPAPSRHG